MTCSVFQGHGLLKGEKMATIDQNYMNALQQAQCRPGQAIPVQPAMAQWYSSLGSLSSSSSPLSSWTTTTDSTGYYTLGGDNTIQQSWSQVPYQAVQAVGKIIKFFRLNKECEAIEGLEVPDPIDRLRIKVARWLRND